jgi:ABC-type lipoprotein release transport system permease subunit
MTIAGVMTGGAIALAGARAIRGMLFGIAAQGAGELGLAALALLALTVVAAWIPANRAASIDPVRVLRDE